MFCRQCGSQIANEAVICVNCGVPTSKRPAVGGGSKSRVAYVLLGLFLGGLGIHNFYAGYAGRGVAQLLITLLLGWLIVPLLAIGIWVLVEICTVTQDSQGNPFI